MPIKSIKFENFHEAFDRSARRLFFISKLPELTLADSIEIDWSEQADDGAVRISLYHDLNQEQLTDLLKNYPNWINNNLLRNLIESFYLYLDNVYLCCYEADIYSKTNNLLSKDKKSSVIKEFRELPVEKKIRELKKYSVIIDKKNDQQAFLSFKTIRDCLSHNDGIVTDKVGHNHENKRKVFWSTYRVYRHRRETLRTANNPVQVSNEESTVTVKLKRHEKVFSVGDEISFSRAELVEIAYTFLGIIEEVDKQLLEFVKMKTKLPI